MLARCPLLAKASKLPDDGRRREHASAESNSTQKSLKRRPIGFEGNRSMERSAKANPERHRETVTEPSNVSQ